MHLYATENMKVEAAGDKIEIVCDNGIYLNWHTDNQLLQYQVWLQIS
jgi:hypothetical protein